ncbi:hypothetical protein Taro_000009 [Colocasia esculenta]|uniref:Uncharacterized protein n=1 Tax=Colocasia esculenta TaxID=4460 RepID=A0A843TB51_COLES|nr:hypothetical protein [Colocasia esculenta]
MVLPFPQQLAFMVFMDRRDYGRSCSPRNYPKMDLGLFEIVPFNRNQRCFFVWIVFLFRTKKIEEPNGSN